MSAVVSAHPDLQAVECPTWCEDHNGSAHRSEVELVQHSSGVARVHMFQFGDSAPRIAVNGVAYSLGQASDIASAIGHLVAQENNA